MVEIGDLECIEQSHTELGIRYMPQTIESGGDRHNVNLALWVALGFEKKQALLKGGIFMTWQCPTII